MVSRLGRWFGIDSDWERLPDDVRRAHRNDLYLAAGIMVLGVVAIELMRSAGMFGEDVAPAYPNLPPWFPHLLAVVTALPLAWRRRFPIGSMLVVYALFLGTGLTFSPVTQVAPLQVVYFMALFSGVAWARDRRAMLVAVAVVLVTMFGWIALQVTDAGVRDEFLRNISDGSTGLFGPWVALTMYQLLVNIAYFGAAIVAGMSSWHAAHRREVVAEQTTTIERQAEELREHAVLEERLRIARELHDVVAHHVSVTGVHAAAARRVLTKSPEKAADALAVIERSSREGVEQMRGLVTTLRQVDNPDGTTPTDSASTANLAGITALANDETDGLSCTYQVVEEPTGASDSVPGPIGAALYRITQESLNNVRKHSTARGVSVTLRVDRRGDTRMPHGWAEVEVLDGGRPRPGTSGSGLGLVGIRERAAAHEGVVEAGPRATVGYRVRVRLPLPDDGSVPDASNGESTSGATTTGTTTTDAATPGETSGDELTAAETSVGESSSDGTSAEASTARPDRAGPLAAPAPGASPTDLKGARP